MRPRLLRFAAAGILLVGLLLAVLLAVGHSRKLAREGIAPPAAAVSRADILLGPYVTAVTDTSAKVLWVTEPNARPAYFGDSPKGPGEGFVGVSLSDKEAPLPDQPEVLHTVTLTGLRPGTLYSYTLHSQITVGDRGDSSGSFRTAPSPGSEKPLKFIVYGDTRSFPERHGAVAEAIRKELPFAFFIHTGDLVSNGMMWEQWKREFFDPARDLLRQAAIWPVRGNHEGDAATYGDLFAPLPNRGLYYGFDWGDAHFVILDSVEQGESPVPKMIEWLDKDLAASKAAWKFAVYHKPTIDTADHGEGWGRLDVWPLLQKHGVDMVFTGHSHVYARPGSKSTAAQTKTRRCGEQKTEK